MAEKTNFEWAPDLYLKFDDYRTRPARDLVMGVGTETPARILDLGCGPGNSTRVLKQRWPAAEIIGIDSSATMLKKARATSPKLTFLQRNITDELHDLGTFDLLFSNAVFQWIPNLQRVIPELFSLLNPKGVLALQVPYARNLPSHRELKRLVSSAEWSQYFDGDIPQPIYRSSLTLYKAMHTLPAAFSFWETRYIQIMQNHNEIIEWNKGSALRPFLDSLPNETLRCEFINDYSAAIRQVYPTEKNGTVLYPFTRIFAVAVKL